MLPRFSKEKSARVDWSYHQSRGSLARTRRWLWLAAAVLVAAPLAVATVFAGLTGRAPTPLASAASRGPLADPHAAWDNQCDACHEPFKAINGNDWLGKIVGRQATGAATRCETCHAGPVHHPNVLMGSIAACAECHRDHLGRNASLVRLADAACVRCHKELEKHWNGPSPDKTAPAISTFATAEGHPEFRLLDAKSSADHHRRTLKFSHAVHNTPGMALGAKGYRFADIPDEADRKRYMALQGETNPNAAVRLACAACHQLDANRSTGAMSELAPAERFAEETRSRLAGLPKEPLQPPRAEGAYFLPVTFEAHCKACHPLTFDESASLRTRQVPHRLQPDEIDQFLREVYAGKFVADGLKPTESPPRGTGRLDPRPGDLDTEARKLARARIEEQVNKAKLELYGGRKTCLECHYAEFPAATAAGVDHRFPTKVRPANAPSIWFTRAKFNHASHKAAACNQCHPAAEQAIGAERTAATTFAAPGTTEPQYQHPPDLPNAASCRACHAPAGPLGTGVRHGCTDCHSFHHADRRLEGLGSPLRDPAERATLEELFRGRVGK